MTCVSTTYLFVVLVFTGAFAICPDSDTNLLKWSDASTWNGNIPKENANLTIDQGILLDVSPPELFSITIVAGGKLIWKSSEEINVRVHYIRIMDQGEMHIGSEDCPYRDNTKITLLGKKRYELDVGFCTEKVLCVDNGGTLELHGKPKLSWTKIKNTIPKFGRSNGLLYSFQDGDMPSDFEYNKNALVVQQFTNKGSHKATKVFTFRSTQAEDQQSITELQNFLNGVPNKNILLFATQRDIVKNDLSALFDVIESILPTELKGHSKLRKVQEHDAYAMVVQKGQNNYEETIDAYYEGRKTHEETTASIVVGRYYFLAKSFNVNNKQKKKSFVDFQVKKYPIIQMVDDVSSWEAGDRVFVTSTDYAMSQTEEATVLPCDSSICKTSNKIMLELDAKYEHYGKIYMNVDMRAEVGLLTRNIIIESEVEDGQNNGGHVKFLRNFKQVRVEGVELTKLGDPIELGRYPLHYHMCLDIGPSGSYLRQNSIHHTFIRCTTIHGTFGAHVQDNTCYTYVGNGFFLEDGGEKNTTLEGNLAAMGYKGDKDNPLIPSDRQPSAFWITNPKTYVRNNVAAGGEGVGFFYVYPVEPIGLTKKLYGDNIGIFFQPDEARRTPIWEFDNNVAHSFHKAGLFIDNTLQPDGEVSDYNFYEPRVDPFDENSEWQLVHINRATAYKNNIQNLWVRGGKFRLYKCSVSDSRQSVIIPKIGPADQYFDTSVVLGDSDNKGEPTTVTYNGKTYNFDHSLPKPGTPDLPRQGYVYSHGPVYLDRIFFNGFISNDVYKAGALSFKLNHDRGSSIRNQVRRIMFGFDDGPTTGNRVFDGNSSLPHFTDINGDVIASLLDTDGSVTGIPGSTVLRNYPFHVTTACLFRENWNLAICPHKYGQIASSFGSEYGDLTLVRSDSMDAKITADPELKALFNVIMDGRHRYFAKFQKAVFPSSDSRIDFKLKGVSRSTGSILIFCIPKDSTKFTFNYRLYEESFTKGTKVSSFDEVENGGLGNYFIDSDIGAMVFKLTHNAEWAGDDFKECPDDVCPEVAIKIRDGTTADNDCVSSAFNIGKYTTTPITDLPPSPMDDMLIDKDTPPSSWGAGSTRPFRPL